MIIAIFCGSSPGAGPAYLDAARHAGRHLAQAGIGIVYGGGRVGLMGAMASAALDHGGHVHGIMTRALVDREIAHRGLTQLDIVETMHERKARMAGLADAFIALPGGTGTLEEMFEQWTWAQLGIHGKPLGFLNVKGYFDPVHDMTTRMVAEGFLERSYAEMLAISDRLEDLIESFRRYKAPTRKWSSSDPDS